MIVVNIPAEVKKVTTEPLWQWDYGQKLKITGDGLPNVCQVHFCDRSCEKAIARPASQTGDGIEVAIPDKLLENEWDIHAFIYMITEGAGNTIKQIQIPINKRKQPETEIDPIPEEVQTELEQLIVNINQTLDDIESLYNDTLTVEDLIAMVDDRVEELTTPVFEKMTEVEGQINDVVENEDLQDRRLTDVEDKAVSNETSIAYLTKEMYAILNGYPAEIYISPTSLEFTGLGIKTIGINAKTVGDPTYEMTYELVSGDAGELNITITNTAFTVDYASAVKQGTNVYKIYAKGNSGIYRTIEVTVH